MAATGTRFEVEHAGCSSCAERLRRALAPLATVEEIMIDETADTAMVSFSANGRVERGAIEAALARASTGSGHQYRLKTGSWSESL